MKVSLNRLVLCLALALLFALAACAGSQPAEPSVNTQINECTKIADREERTRCIDAAHRTN
ncbi:MAG TPA: hypothetical protein VJ984_07205 [Xanthomonadales bacterium]|nr:hypothetical protein [Xanthomonadales bacterium]